MSDTGKPDYDLCGGRDGGSHMCCLYLATASGEGAICLRGTATQKYLDALEHTRSQRRPVLPYPECQEDPLPVDGEMYFCEALGTDYIRVALDHKDGSDRVVVDITWADARKLSVALAKQLAWRDKEGAL